MEAPGIHGRHQLGILWILRLHMKKIIKTFIEYHFNATPSSSTAIIRPIQSQIPVDFQTIPPFETIFSQFTIGVRSGV